MNQRTKWSAQVFLVFLGALMLKLHYSTASPDQLRWILAPTTVLVELFSGRSFEFESYAGYMSSDRTFLIAASCAGVNFLITAFMMLSLKRLWRDRLRGVSYRAILMTGALAYLVTIIANTVRICVALRLQEMSPGTSWLSSSQLHRFEGILIYFGFLLLLLLLTETTSLKRASSLLRQSLFLLLIYYAITLGIPLANGAYGQGTGFWEHSLFVLLTPLVVVSTVVAFRFLVSSRRPILAKQRAAVESSPN